jgi:MFS family permease
VAFAFAVAALGATLPTPIFPLYERQFGLSTAAVTVVFSTYAIAVVVTLLVAGGSRTGSAESRFSSPGCSSRAPARWCS